MVLDLDIDECTLGLHECSTNATCVNTPGFYTCHCNSGYAGNGRTCASKYPCTIYFELTINTRTCLSTKNGRWHHYLEEVPNLTEHRLYVDLRFIKK